uniref:Uncharacterized protein n=1 Tax=Panagrellus redivivus TaxID=6233 RepID=A0A7E4UXV1_PANRE
MKRFWVDNVMEKVNIPLNTEFIYQGFENYLFLFLFHEKFVYQNNTLVHEFQFINGNDKIEGIKFTEMFTKNGINQIVAKHDDSNLPYKVTYVKVQMED